ncbi:alpha/beta fold hydrolase [Nonomuraea sp. NPDC059194]|uniref:alpha/beta fold hydrolase n=1 Tax=Nonomuraea sp. NPDC059194 TaxID=3346764 RepID=UPI0036C863CA
MERRLTLGAAYAFVVGAVLYSAWLPGQLAAPALDRLDGYIGELAARDQPWSRMFRACDGLAGLACIGAVALVARVREEWQGWLAMALFGLFTALAALFPLDCADCGRAPSPQAWLHVLSGGAANAAVLVAMVLLSAAWRSAVGWGFTAVMFTASGVTLVADVLGGYAGLAQRVQATLIAVWLIYLATRLLGAATPRVVTGPMHVVNEGAGHPVLVSSGPAGAWFHADEVAEGLRDGRSVIRFDRPGLGRSPAALTPPTLYGEAARLAALVPDPIRATVVAHSVAAWHAEAFARLHPLRVAGLVLVEPACELRRHRRALPAGLGRWLPAFGATWGATALARVLGPPLHRLRRGAVDPYGVYATGRVAAAAVGEWLAHRDMARTLWKLRRERPLPAVPVTVISGGRRNSGHERLAAALGARLVRVPHRELPAAVVEACR